MNFRVTKILLVKLHLLNKAGETISGIKISWFIQSSDDKVQISNSDNHLMYRYNELSEIELNAYALKNREKTSHMDICEESRADLNKVVETEPNDAFALRSRGILIAR
ncbi:hypothetical protein C2G38_2036340 [Gigaspora rosea]|uniref:Uncharacterized protein n=1 Tax=Gigaspora rosea TaxID=44941 RepID=A0A397VCP0_9GLOM|nr:hypothetical protein C2G38_2036340 [Gigaspora rosea]